MKIPDKLTDIVLTITEASVIVFGLFIAYQLTRKILGGSWSTEDLIIAMVMANITITFGVAMKTTKISSDLKHLTKQFNCLATDFKAHTKQFNELSRQVSSISNRLDNASAKLDMLSPDSKTPTKSSKS